MLYALAVALIVLWLLGLVPFSATGGFIHALLLIGLVERLSRIHGGRWAL
ncbi:MAG: lmo0937 family membrane protein [Burkholderiaceae bacterium]|nr:lmo0937 family membrane protein [Burkholderiaceae bacterium]